MTTSPTQQSSSPPSTVSPRSVRGVIAALLTLVMLAALDQSVLATALPTISRDLGGVDLYAWAVTAYLLPGTAVMPLYGKAVDVFGPRRTLAVAGCLFILGSLLCGLSQSMPALLASRAVQGLGAAGLMTLAFTITFLVSPPQQRPWYLSLFGVVFTMSSLVGPVVGGGLAELSWRSIFLLNVPLAAVATLLVRRALRNFPATSRSARLDWPGAALLCAAALAWVTLASLAGTWLAWDSAVLWVVVAGALAATTALVRRERGATDPLLPLHMFKDRLFALASAGSALIGVVMFGGVLFLPLYLQAVKGLSPTVTGLATLPMMVAMVLTSTISSRHIGRSGVYRPWLVAGSALTASSLAGAGFIGADTPVPWTLGILAVLGAGIGLCMQNILVVAQAALPPGAVGAGTAMVTFMRQVGASLGTAVLGSIFALLVRPVGDQFAEGGLLDGAESAAFVEAINAVVLTASVVAVALTLAMAALPGDRLPKPVQTP